MLYGRCAFSAPWVAVFAMRRVELVVILGTLGWLRTLGGASCFGLAARRWGIGVVGLVFLWGIIHGECAKITMTHSPQKGKNSNINLFLLFPSPYAGVVPRFAEYLKVGGVSHPIDVS